MLSKLFEEELPRNEWNGSEVLGKYDKKKTPTNTKTIERNTNTYTQRVNERQGVKDTQRTTTTTSE